jgi:DNA repair protein RadA/Sms
MRARTESLQRTLTGLAPFDAALGGGLVAGSAMLLSGDKGTGKSTLALWLLRSLRSAIYVASEETREQVEDRATRTLPDALGCPLLVTQNLTEVLRHAQERQLTVVDSLHLLDGKVEDNAKALLRFCKERNTTLVAIAQLTKDGKTVRGGGIVEYVFDVHCQLSREDPLDRANKTRVLTTLKNRYGEEGEWRLRLGATGWREVPPPDPSPPPDPAAGREALEFAERTHRTEPRASLRVLRTPRDDRE